MGQLSKEQFIKIMNKIENDMQCGEAMQNVMKSYNIEHDFFEPYCLFDNNLSELVDVLQVMFDDEGEWIGYYVFECGCDFKNFAAWDEEGHYLGVDTLDDLWRLINKK